jgi:predicted ribonuclease YlaK
MVELEVGEDDIGSALLRGAHRAAAAARLPCHTALRLLSARGSALGRVTADKQVRLVRGDREAFGLHGRSAEQRVALDLLLDPEVGIVSLGGRAGTGKSALALCAGLENVLERRAFKRVVVFRPLYAVGGQELGYLPGSEGEKMQPWAQAVFDTLGALVSKEVVDHVLDSGMIEVLPLTHIRGRSLHDSFVIVDEAQSLERGVLLTVLSRLGAGSRVVLTHDVAQRDNLRWSARRRGRGHRGAEGASAVRPRHADPLGAVPDRRPGHRDARRPSRCRRSRARPRSPSGSGASPLSPAPGPSRSRGGDFRPRTLGPGEPLRPPDPPRRRVRRG